MNRWQVQYDNHPFHQVWKQIIESIAHMDKEFKFQGDDVEEFARAKKVTTYIQGLMDSCDKQLVPQDVWANFQGHCPHCSNALNRYGIDKNSTHLVQANDYLTSLISFLKPYVVDGRSAARASTIAQKEYQEVVSDHINTIHKRSDGLIKALNDKETRMNSALVDVKRVELRVKELEQSLFVDKPDVKSFQTRYQELNSEIEAHAKEINDFSDRVFSDSFGVSDQLQSLISRSDEMTAEIMGHLDTTKSEIKELKSFYIDVFGNDTEGDEKKISLKEEIEIRRESLILFANSQDKKYKTLLNEIESLIPGATTAGLASAYSELKTEAGEAVNTYSRLFYGAIALLSTISFGFFIKDFSLATLSITFLDSTDWTESLKQALQRIPIIIPIVWFTLFASKRRSEQHRLQQEYSHKEAIAKSYHAFKQQIDALGEDEKHKGLMLKLLNSAIESIAFNASDTLDKKHGDNTPVLSVLEKLTDSINQTVKANKG